MFIIRATIAIVSLGAAVVFAQSTSNTNGSFDKPIQKKVVALGRSTYLKPNDPERVYLSCFYYPSYMVKQLSDPGVKGTLSVTVTPISDGHRPTCRLAHASTEQLMEKDWWGFVGVKGSLLFLEAADGDENAGMPFRIVDMKTGKKVFEDSARGGINPTFAHASDGRVTLSYVRRVGGDCSIPKDGMRCWIKFREHYGLALVTVPTCLGYRREGEKEWTAGDDGLPPEDSKTPSALDYPAVLELFPQTSVRAAQGPVQCFPVQ